MNKYTAIVIAILILVICNLVALLIYNFPGSDKVLSIVSTAISIALSLVAICISIVSNSDASNSLGRANEALIEIKTKMSILHEEQAKASNLFEKMAQLNESIKDGTMNNTDKEKQKKIDAEFSNIRKSFESYSRTARII
jgi:uncharacterized protein YdcH (DUF465 family)